MLRWSFPALVSAEMSFSRRFLPQTTHMQLLLNACDARTPSCEVRSPKCIRSSCRPESHCEAGLELLLAMIPWSDCRPYELLSTLLQNKQAYALSAGEAQ